MKKKMIDERQERDMYVIEHYGFWFAFWGLLTIILVQLILGKPFENFIYEWFIFMVLAIGSTIGYSKKGIWSPGSKPDQKEYVKSGVLVFIAVMGILLLMQAFRGDIFDLFTVGADFGLSLFAGILVYSLTRLMGEKVKKEEESDEE